MARPPREEFEGALWHVTSRGNEKKNVFFDDEDRANYLARLARAVEVYGRIIHAYETNEYNFEKVANPPPFEPTLCGRCGKRIVLPEGGYVRGPQGIWCQACDDYPPPDLSRIRKMAKKRRR